MTHEQITRILDDHGIPYYTNSGNIYADSMEAGTALFENVVNVSAWTRSQLYAWLGY